MSDKPKSIFELVVQAGSPKAAIPQHQHTGDNPELKPVTPPMEFSRRSLPNPPGGIPGRKIDIAKLLGNPAEEISDEQQRPAAPPFPKKDEP